MFMGFSILKMASLDSIQATTEECVILLHGLARSDRSMNKLAAALKHSGYSIVNYGYPSTRYPIEKLAENAISDALTRCCNPSKIHFVTHSLGGILVRQYLNTHVLKNLGRVVMLGPPNRGSQVVDKLAGVPGFKLINGPAGVQLGTGELSVPKALGPAHYELGIIAGTRSINLILSALLPSPNDGKVTVENTRLEGMTDHITLPVTHTFMMRNAQVIGQVIHFLKYGAFKNR